MATPGELVKVTATVLGLPEAYVASTYRMLREAGLVTKGGRGPSAAKMTARDAATLLGGILGTGQIVDAANAVGRFLNMRDLRHSPPTPFQRHKIAGLADLPAGHSFLDALEAIISVATAGKLIRIPPPAEWEWDKVEVTVDNPATYARIHIRIDPTRGISASAGYELPKKHNPKEDWEARFRRSQSILRESRKVNTVIFLYLGALLAGKPLPGLETLEVTQR